MNIIHDLATLISGLSKREKSDFEQYASRQGDDQRYMRVYKVLEQILATAKSAADIPDESVLMRRIRLKVKGGNFTAYCTYLYKAILRSLRSSQDTSKKEDEILQDTNNAKILARRGMFDAAIISLNTAFEAARKYEYHALAIQALRELVYLESQRDSKSYADKIRERLQKITELANLQTLESYYYQLHYRAFLLTRIKGPMHQEAVQAELQELNSHELLSDISKAPTFFAQVYYWQARASLANMESDHEKALNCSKNIVDLWQDAAFAHLQAEHPRLYIVHLHNLVSFAFASRDFELGEQYLKALEGFPCANFDDKAEQFQNALFSRQFLLMNTGRLREAVIEVTEKLKEIEGIYSAKINTARLISLYYNTLVACFVLNDFEGAQAWSEKIYQIGKTEQRRDIQFINKVFQIIIRFELGQLHLLDNEIKNTTENLRYHGQLDETNALILQWLARLLRNRMDNVNSRKLAAAEEKSLFVGFREELLAKKVSNANRQVIGLDEVLIWVGGKVG